MGSYSAANLFRDCDRVAMHEKVIEEQSADDLIEKTEAHILV